MFINPLVQEKFAEFSQKYTISPKQAEQFQHYMQVLLEWNTHINLTAITKPEEIINLHFDDSLAITKVIDFKTLHCIADIGTGAGFPGIPLKILFPHLNVILIEVTQKKIRFLQEVIEELGLQNIEIFSADWRTFLRKTTYSIDLFIARASLQPEELVKIFQPASPYNTSTLVYMASSSWHPGVQEKKFFVKEVTYVVDSMTRKLAFFSKSS